MLTSGFVAAIHHIFKLPFFIASICSQAEKPCLPDIFPNGKPHIFSISFLSILFLTNLYPGRRCDKPPASLPPIALGWPVKEKGPAPFLHIWPVIKCKFIRPLTAAVPSCL